MYMYTCRTAFSGGIPPSPNTLVNMISLQSNNPSITYTQHGFRPSLERSVNLALMPITYVCIMSMYSTLIFLSCRQT